MKRLMWIVVTWLSGAVAIAIANPRDPGVRQQASDNSPPAGLTGLAQDELAYFEDGLARFETVEVVNGAGIGQGNGLGPRFNSDSCVSCHAQPNPGGSSPAQNPLLTIATAYGAANNIPWFIAADGPVREARFVQSNGTADGGVHKLFVVSGRSDAGSCALIQPSFGPPGDPVSGQGGNPNVIFRIPTPLFGAGLIEAIPDSAILANKGANASLKTELGIKGHPNAHISGTANTSANDGTITRFGWKAQNKSLLLFAAEAYNVEMGVTNELFPQERDETPGCVFNPTPEDALNFSATPNTAVLSDIEAFANFMRMLAPPAPAPDTPSIVSGRATFAAVGCAACHTPTLRTAKMIASGSSTVPSAALADTPVNLYSDLLLHHMGERLDDGIVQGQAATDEFRTAPLWGIGQRVFFLHDGRTTDLVEAIEAHRSRGSEATEVVSRFNQLDPAAQQDLVNFLRSL